MLRDYDVVMRYEPWGSFCTIVDLRSSQLVAYFKPHHESNPLKEVLLSDPPIGPLVGRSVFESGVEYNIHVFWPLEERGRFESTGSLTLAQGAWLKKHFGNENKFLRTYNLNIDKDEDRAEGRAIVRSMMRHDGGE